MPAICCKSTQHNLTLIPLFRTDLADAQAKSAKLQRRIAGIETATAALRETMALVDQVRPRCSVSTLPRCLSARSRRSRAFISACCQVNNEIARLGDDEARLEDLRRDAEEHKVR